MTYEEAIDNLKYLISDDCTDTQNDFVEEIKIAICALEKQIPKKPIIRKAEDYFGNVKHTLCPNCQETEFVFTQPCFCHHCGQAIDWEASE